MYNTGQFIHWEELEIRCPLRLFMINHVGISQFSFVLGGHVTNQNDVKR